MNYWSFLKTAVFIVQNLDYIMSSLCPDSHHFWCQKSGIELNNSYSAFSTSFQLNYKICLRFCHKNSTCKAFQYNNNGNMEKVCRFSSNLSNIEKRQTSNVKKVMWKKTPGITCEQEIVKGRGFFLVDICVQYLGPSRPF